MRVSINGEPPNGWFIRENPLKWMIWGYPYFRKPIYDKRMETDVAWPIHPPSWWLRHSPSVCEAAKNDTSVDTSCVGKWVNTKRTIFENISFWDVYSTAKKRTYGQYHVMLSVQSRTVSLLLRVMKGEGEGWLLGFLLSPSLCGSIYQFSNAGPIWNSEGGHWAPFLNSWNRRSWPWKYRKNIILWLVFPDVSDRSFLKPIESIWKKPILTHISSYAATDRFHYPDALNFSGLAILTTGHFIVPALRLSRKQEEHCLSLRVPKGIFIESMGPLPWTLI